ncbi:Down syndrome cell adhesion molecule-like protein [Penaeus vannamei]|uniref:Down syndrome cell adhesion molecule-like protein n=1 Tax=Penaeus vannamei TaxID=6689 RepID=A0A423THX2_PENVA|nr:Down syndrome cell adhesion molecule-like protein [Penaeus vannamei]
MCSLCRGNVSYVAPSCPPAGVSCRGSGRGVVRVWWSQPPTHCSQTPVAGYTIVATPTTHTHHPSDSTKWEVNTTNLEKNLDSLPPATNISVRVKAFNNVGFSPSNKPVFCVTEDDIPGAPGKVQVTVTGPRKVLVTWVPPQPPTGNILHYTLYSVKDDQVRDRDVVGAAGSESTWRELRDLAPSSRIEVWVTATTAAGEGNPSPRLTALLKPTATHAPVALGGGRTWRVGAGAGVTLGCRGRGKPAPSIVWSRGGQTITSGQFTQLLPGGDLHLTGVRETANYTCKVSNTMGVDSLTHHVIVVTMPPPPTLSLAYATHDALNLTIVPTGDGGAPILGYTVHHRGRAGEWVETEVDPGVESAAVRGLPCGAPHHLYLTAWNSHGTSPPSPVLEVSTHGAPPGRPNPAKIVEVNATCVTLRLYAWPESGCPVTHWKVEQGSEDPAVLWTPLHAHVTRDMTDLGLCDLTSASRHLLRLTASSTAGDTTVVYRVTTRDHTGGSIAAESVQEVQVSGPPGVGGWLDAHVVAGVVSALLLAAALIICVCVAVRRRRQGESLDNKGGGEDDNARNSELTRAHLYSPTPTKKPRGSLASLKTQDDASDPYEICPYATFSVGSSEGTLEYGLSLHALTPRDCLDLPAAHSDRHPHEAPGYAHPPRQRAQSHYKETETRAWAEDPRKDTRSRPHRSRSRNRASGSCMYGPATINLNILLSNFFEGRRHPLKNLYQCPRRNNLMKLRCNNAIECRECCDRVLELTSHIRKNQYHQVCPETAALLLMPVAAAYPRCQCGPALNTDSVRRDSSTESNDASSPERDRLGRSCALGRTRCHLSGMPGSHRARTESSSSESSPLTPPRPLHPPSAFSDSRELSEAECDREIFQSEGGSGGGSRPRRQSEGEDIKAELTVLLQRTQTPRPLPGERPSSHPVIIMYLFIHSLTFGRTC